MDFDFYNWSTNLFAYLYQHYEGTELVNELPFRMKYEVSETFHRRVGECQVRVNSILRKHLQSVFEKNYLVVCRGISTFRAYIERSCLKLSHKFEPQISFIGFSAVVSELNLYCFQRGCYRYALYAPECLEKILQRSDYVALSISDRQDCNTSEGFEKLLQCCENILEHSTSTPSSKRKEIVKFGKSFAKNELRRFRRKNRLFKMPMGDVQEENYSSEEKESKNKATRGGSSGNEATREGSSGNEATCEISSGNEDTCEGSSGNEGTSEDSSSEEDPFAQENRDANLLAATKPFNRNACRICQEENCQRYLEEFVRQFSSGEMKYGPLTMQ